MDRAVDMVRTGSRGLLWLEPMVEVETREGRIAYGPVTRRDVDALIAAGMLDGADHPLRLGRPEDIPYLAKQQRLTGPKAVPDYANPTQMNRYTWYQTHDWTKPYPGDKKVYAPADVPGAYLPSPDSDG
jgi:hypothetical protein